MGVPPPSFPNIEDDMVKLQYNIFKCAPLNF